MRRTIGVLLLCLSFGLLAATPSPQPNAAPTPKATFLPTPGVAPSGIVPTVVIYPFETPTDVDARTGGAIAQIYAQVLTQSGGLNVLAIPQKIKREDWDKYAHSVSADYYISGYVQPIGNIAAIVARVVDVNTEIAVYSQTTQIQSVPDVASQALTARTVVLQAAGVDRPQAVVQSGKATPTPSSTEGASYNVNSVLSGVGGLFKRGGKTTAAAATPVPVKPLISMIVAHLTGNASSGDIAQGSDELFRAMNTYYKASASAANPTNLAKEADTICGTNRHNTIASGVLNATHVGGLHAHSEYSFTLNVYTCFGSVLFTNTQTNADKLHAIRDAVEAYQKAHPDNT